MISARHQACRVSASVDDVTFDNFGSVLSIQNVIL